jgi:uncharacterized membrane protein YfcA
MMSAVELGTLQPLLAANDSDGSPTLQVILVACFLVGGAYMLWSGRRMASRSNKITTQGMEKAIRILIGIVSIIIGAALALAIVTT